MLFDCRHTALAANRSEHSALFHAVGDVRELMDAAYKPEPAIILGSCMQGMLKGLGAGLYGRSNATPAS
jgi:hypothetical protein